MPLSTFLNGRAYTTLRGAAFLALSETGHVISGSITDDAGGGGTTTWTAGSAIPCRIDPLGSRGDEREIGGRISERSTHFVHIPSGTEVVAGDTFAIDGRGTFEITAVPQRTAEMVRLIEVVQS